MSISSLPPRARAIMVCDAAAPVARAVALRLAELGHVVLAASEDPDAIADLPRETARSGLIEIATGPLAAAPARALAVFGRLDSAVITAERWAFGPTFAQDGPLPVAADRPLVAEALDIARAFVGQPARLESASAGPSARRRLMCVSTLPTIPFTGIGPAQHRAFEALARALRYELRVLGADVCMVSADLVAPPAGDPSLGARLQASLAALPEHSAYRALAAPLTRAVLALARQAPPVERICEAIVQGLLASRPRNLQKVRGSGGRLAVPVALRNLDKVTRKVAQRSPH